MAQEQRGVELFSGLKLLSSSFQMHASHHRTSHRLPRFDSVQRQGQTTTYRSLKYEPNKVTPHPRNYISFYPDSIKPRIIEALRMYPYRIFNKFYTYQTLPDNYHKTNFRTYTVIYQGTPPPRRLIQLSRKLCSIKYNRPAYIP